MSTNCIVAETIDNVRNSRNSIHEEGAKIQYGRKLIKR